MIIENVRTKDLQPGDRIISGPNGGGSLDTYAFWTVEREQEPVPPLPTEPFTVIRVQWRDDSNPTVFVLYPDDRWHDDSDWVYCADQISGYAGFEVLAEPRTGTAKAVLDRAFELTDHDGITDLLAVAREFGATGD